MSSPGSLPLKLTSFVGREQEMAEVRRLIDTSRLLTLTGHGGCGKTRLALEVARSLPDHLQEDRVRFVDLSPLKDAQSIGGVVASTLTVREKPGRSTSDSLIEHIGEQDLLLILDNCEHLVEGCALFANALLLACPNLRIIATSREPLKIAGEVIWQVPALSTPDAEHPPDLAAMDQFEAVRLFIDRARMKRPDFEVIEQNRVHLSRLCAHLDGMPLAIELAAARTSVLSLEQIVERLDSCLQLLSQKSHLTPERHQTLHAAIDWSYNLLSDPEKALLGRLAVFTRSFSLEAAEAVCADETAGMEVLDLLEMLVSKSLVNVESYVGEARYRLLEVIRQYALGAFTSVEELEELHASHAGYYVRLVEEAETHFTGPQKQAWLSRLDAEYSNLRAAIDWSLAGETAEGNATLSYEPALRMAGALWRFWHVRGYYREGRQIIEAALTAAPVPQPAVANTSLATMRARALTGAGYLAWASSDYERARACHEESLAAGRELGDDRIIAQSLNNLGLVAWRQGDYGTAEALYTEALALNRNLGDKHGTATGLTNMAILAVERSDYSTARKLYEQCLETVRALGDRQSIAGLLNNLAIVASHEADWQAARALHEEAVGLMRELNNRAGLGLSVTSLAKVIAQTARHPDDYAKARDLCEEGLALARDLGDRHTTAYGLDVLAEIEQAQGDYPAALNLFRQSLALVNELGSKEGVASRLEGIAKTAWLQGNMTRAARIWGAAEALRRLIGSSKSAGERGPGKDAVASARKRTTSDGHGWDTSWQEGRSMLTEQGTDHVIAYAMEDSAGSQITFGPAPAPPSAARSPNELTRREIEVLRLLAEGLTDAQIAQRLFLSPHTVHAHLHSVYSKLNVPNRSAAARFAYEHNLT